MDEINDAFSDTDMVLVIGANDQGDSTGCTSLSVNLPRSFREFLRISQVLATIVKPLATRLADDFVPKPL